MDSVHYSCCDSAQVRYLLRPSLRDEGRLTKTPFLFPARSDVFATSQRHEIDGRRSQFHYVVFYLRI